MAEKRKTEMLHDMEVDKYLHDCVALFPEAIGEEMTRLPADLAYWNARYADVLRAFLKAKLDEDRTFARVAIYCREELAQSGKVTEAMVTAAVEKHPDIEAARLATIEAEVEKVRLYGVLDAIRSKRDMLQSLGAQLRVEMEHDPVARERSGVRALTGK